MRTASHNGKDLAKEIALLKSQLEELTEAHPRRIERDLHRLGMTGMVAVGGVRVGSARIADPGRDDALLPAYQVLHAPEAAPREHGTFDVHLRSSTWSR